MSNKINISTTNRDLYEALTSNKRDGISIDSHQAIDIRQGQIWNSFDSGIIYNIVVDVIWPIGAGVLSNIIYDFMKKRPNTDIIINRQSIEQNSTIINIETAINITIQNDKKENEKSQ